MGMFQRLFFLSCTLIQFVSAQSLPEKDWLVTPLRAPVNIDTSAGRLTISNGLLRRSFLLQPNISCVDFSNLTTGQQLLRSIEPEARLVINGTTYQVGGARGQSEKAYWTHKAAGRLASSDSDFHFTHWTTGALRPRIKGMDPYPVARGREIQFHFTSRLPLLSGMEVTVHYAIYQGMPLLEKWLTIAYKGEQQLILNRVVHEVLGLVEEESAVVGRPEEMKKQHGLYVETNYAFNNAMRYDISDQTTHWKTDPAYTSQVNYNFQTPCLLEIYPEHAPGIELKKGATFESVHTWELLMDSYDRQRRGLMIRKMYRTIAPWITRNPIFMHLVSKRDDEVIQAIDQCVATGYEAVILSFGSHLNMEDSSTQNITRWKKLADYAHQKKILLGGYSLFSSRRISDEDDVIDVATGKPGGAFFGNAPCFGSKWGLSYRDKIKHFFAATGFDIWENDGPYPGDRCASKQHPGHSNWDDSQWKQMEIQKELYRWLNERGVYINAPDWYFLDGTHKIAIGYREVNFSLSREQQIILNRQNIHDGTIEKTPSMGWGFVPLTQYQGGGPEAVLEPLREHLPAYRQLMMQYYGAGVQACYRGPRLYDADTTRQMVAAVIAWYKKYRAILNADIIQLRRADGRDWDGWMHVDPLLPQKALFMLFNPTDTAITRTIRLPLYYTGKTTNAIIKNEQGKAMSYRLGRDYTIPFTFSLPAGGYSWYTVE
ncbi:MAG: alpha-galactosidase [Bacteroidota bacterium]